MSEIIAALYKDFYKADHRRQYPENTTLVYSNLTARSTRIPYMDRVVNFGLQAVCKKVLIESFNKSFFSVPKDEILKAYKRRMDTSLGPNGIGTDHIEALHDLGFLPIEIKSLPEGSLVPLKVPLMTIKNTLPQFFWITNFLETVLSNSLWHPITSATIANYYRKMLDVYAKDTSSIPEFVQWQGHDFSMRGHASLDAALASGAAHLLSFTGTDTIPAIDFLEKYYGADADKELIGGSVPATEHSVMCLGGNESEVETFERLITKVYPSGIVSIVSDTWDYWQVISKILPALKFKIMAREGKVVIRPDSGDPEKIICGDSTARKGSLEYRGTVEALWDEFGGDVNSKGYKELDPHIGVIYGDSITPTICDNICYELKKKGFASTNVVFGIGSFTYQHVTRDTFGFAIKATYGIVNGQPAEIWKNPKTDNGGKKSAKGLLRVDSGYVLKECVSVEEEKGGLLETVFLNGRMVKEQTLSQIRERLKKETI